jgi:alpha-beta hydrolase superfamily lysophospholipase
MVNIVENVVTGEASLSFLEPEGGPAQRGTVVVVPGRGERAEVYTRFGTRLSVDAYRVHVVTDPTVDVDGARDQIASAAAGAIDGATHTPIVLAGSDTGALFAAALVATGELKPDGLILAGLPLAQDPTPAAASWDEELDARTTCPTHRGRLSESLVSPGALYGEVPETWLQQATLSEIDLPILGLHGRDDPITPLDAVREAFARAPEAELVGIADARHDVLNNMSHRTVAATIVLWLERLRLGRALPAIATTEPLGADVA